MKFERNFARKLFEVVSMTGKYLELRFPESELFDSSGAVTG